MSAIIKYTEMYHPFLLPTNEDIKNFIEHGENDEMDIISDTGFKPIPSDTHDEDTIFRSTPSPPYHRDLVDILHR